MALGIPNLNSCTITYQFKDLLKSIVRRLGRPTRVGGASALAGGVSSLIANDISVTYDSTFTPKLYVTYLRLMPFRVYPQSSALTVFRREIRRPVEQEVGNKTFDAGLFDKAGARKGIQCSGGMSEQPSALTLRPPSCSIPNIKQKSEVDVQFTNCQFAQIPNYLFVVMQKDSDVFNLQNPFYGVDTVGPPAAGNYSAKWETVAARGFADTHGHITAQLTDHNANLANAAAEVVHTFNSEVAGRYIAQNRDSNASILQFSCVIQSALGSFEFMTSAQPYLRDRDHLWQKHVANCCDSYMPEGRQRWSDKASCLLLASSDFCLGLSSPGVVFPIIADVKVKFGGRSGVKSGLVFSNGQTKGVQIYDDFIVGTPCLVACYNQQILSLASSSGVLSSQAFSQATYASAISQQR